MQAADNMPVRGTIANWIHDMFKHFEPDIIAEVAAARSAISICLDYDIINA
jgi:hypothetical protein